MTHEEIQSQRHMMVVQHNDLVRDAKNLLTAQEQNMLYYLVSKVKPDDKDFMTVHFTVEEFGQVCGIDTSGKNYTDVKKALKTLADKSVWAYDKTENADILLKWIDTYRIERDSGKMTATLSQSVKPFLIGLIHRGNYTESELVTFLAMRSKYAKRLYELLKSHVNMKYPAAYSPATVVYALPELARLLDAETYTTFKDLRVKAIDPAIKEIVGLSDILASYETRTGPRRKVEAVAFTVRLKEPHVRDTVRAEAHAALDGGREERRARKTGPAG